jgi:hypothetical protein
VLVVLDGGPRDGTEYVIDADVVEVRVTMADGSLHLYERVPTERIFPDGRRLVIFRWRGRR